MCEYFFISYRIGLHSVQCLKANLKTLILNVHRVKKKVKQKIKIFTITETNTCLNYNNY